MNNIEKELAALTKRDRGGWEGALRGVDMNSYPLALLRKLTIEREYGQFTTEGVSLFTFSSAFAIAVAGYNPSANNGHLGLYESRGLFRLNVTTFDTLYGLAKLTDPLIPDGLIWDTASIDAYNSLQIGFALSYYFVNDVSGIPDPLANGVTFADLQTIASELWSASRAKWFMTACALLGTEDIGRMINLATDVVDACEAMILLQVGE